MTQTRKNLTSAAMLAALLALAPAAHANNTTIETTIRSVGDLSMFYQAMLNTGVANELSETQHYTIFAPTNAAFAQISPQKYPCFYSAQCRPQIAALLRDHIVPGKHDVSELTTYGSGIGTIGGVRAMVAEPYVNDYTVDGRTILSKTESGGNVIYRVDGVLANPQQLGDFQNVAYPAPYAEAPTIQVIQPTTTIATQRQITTYDPKVVSLQPRSSNTATMATIPDNMTETTTIISGTTTETVQ